jgi:hypothetical protein
VDTGVGCHVGARARELCRGVAAQSQKFRRKSKKRLRNATGLTRVNVNTTDATTGATAPVCVRVTQSHIHIHTHTFTHHGGYRGFTPLG